MAGKFILIIGAYGFGNMGDEAILQGILEKIDNKENVEVMSAIPKETEVLHGVKAVLRGNIDYSRYNTVILGGGGYRPGDYGNPLGIALKLKKMGAKLIIKAIGLSAEISGKEKYGSGKPGTQENTILKQIVEKADYFSVRTPKDLKRIKDYTHTTRNIKIETCPALGISFSKEEGRRLLEKFGFSTNEKLCGVSVSRFGYRKGIKDFLKTYQKDFSLLPIPMCRHYFVGFENDVLLLKKYFKELGEMNPSVMKMLNYKFTPSELKSVLSNLEFLVAARKHAMVLALGVGLDPKQMILLGTRESGLADYSGVKEIDWRQWSPDADGMKFFFAKKNPRFLFMNVMLKAKIWHGKFKMYFKSDSNKIKKVV